MGFIEDIGNAVNTVVTGITDSFKSNPIGTVVEVAKAINPSPVSHVVNTVSNVTRNIVTGNSGNSGNSGNTSKPNSSYTNAVYSDTPRDKASSNTSITGRHTINLDPGKPGAEPLTLRKDVSNYKYNLDDVEISYYSMGGGGQPTITLRNKVTGEKHGFAAGTRLDNYFTDDGTVKTQSYYDPNSPDYHKSDPTWYGFYIKQMGEKIFDNPISSQVGYVYDAMSGEPQEYIRDYEVEPITAGIGTGKTDKTETNRETYKDLKEDLVEKKIVDKVSNREPEETKKDEPTNKENQQIKTPTVQNRELEVVKDKTEEKPIQKPTTSNTVTNPVIVQQVTPQQDNRDVVQQFFDNRDAVYNSAPSIESVGYLALDCVAPTDAVNVVSKLTSGRGGELTAEDWIWAGLDVLSLVTIPFTLGGSVAIKAGAKGVAKAAVKGAKMARVPATAGYVGQFGMAGYALAGGEIQE